MGPRNHALDGNQDRTNPFTSTRDDNSAMRPFAKLLWILVLLVIHFIWHLSVRRYLLTYISHRLSLSQFTFSLLAVKIIKCFTNASNDTLLVSLHGYLLC